MSRAYDKDGNLIPVEGEIANGETVQLKYNGTTKAFDVEGRRIDAKPYVRQSRKIGRNEPCPCGSGLKYKKCHLGK